LTAGGRSGEWRVFQTIFFGFKILKQDEVETEVENTGTTSE
jgi:hypothetical protein